MSDIWIISDTHFHHENIIKFSDRPFKDSYHMNEMLIQNWNSLIKPKDKVYHLGDVYMGSNEDGAKVLSRLNGRKRLVLGNHDDPKQQALWKYFDKIMLWRPLSDFKVLLTHLPVHLSSFDMSGVRKDWINVHGHIHNQEPPTERHINVCVEKTNYHPINIEQFRYC